MSSHPSAAGTGPVSQVAFMEAHAGLSMAEKLRLWKAQKAANDAAASAPAAKQTATAKPAAPAAKAAAPAAKAIKVASKPPAPTRAPPAPPAPTRAAPAAPPAPTRAPPPAPTRAPPAVPKTKTAPSAAATSTATAAKTGAIKSAAVAPAPVAPVTAASAATTVARKPIQSATNKRPFGAVTTAASTKTTTSKAPLAAAATAAGAKRAKVEHKSSARNNLAVPSSSASSSAANSARTSPAVSAQASPACSTHSSPQQAQQDKQSNDSSMQPLAAEPVCNDDDVAMDSAEAEAEDDAVPEVATKAPATPPAASSSSAAARAAFTTPIAPSFSSASTVTPAAASTATAAAASSSSASAAAFDSLTARLQAWKSARGIQLTASVTKARLADEKRRHALEVKASMAAAAAGSGTAAPPKRMGTPSLKVSGLASLGIDAAFSRIQSLMRRAAWADAERLVSQLLLSPATAAEVESRAEVWVCRAYIAEQQGMMDQVVSLYDAARQARPALEGDAAFQQVVHRGFQSFMCRLAGVDARVESERQPRVLDQFLAPPEHPLLEEAGEDEEAAAAAAEEKAQAAADAAKQAEDEAAMDAILSAANDSFASVGPNSACTTPAHLAHQRRLATPVSSNLRAALMADSTAAVPASAGRTLTLKASTNTFTPRSALLRAELTAQRTPPTASKTAVGGGAGCMTPVAASLASELRVRKTPSPETGSMAALARDSARIGAASASRSAARRSAAQAAAAAASSDAYSPSLSAPASASASPSLSDSPDANRRDSLPLVRNLLGEMDDNLEMGALGADNDALNSSTLSCASLGASPPKHQHESTAEEEQQEQEEEQEQEQEEQERSATALEFLDDSMQLDGDVDGDALESYAAGDRSSGPTSASTSFSSEHADLFMEDEYIPGLSTPAPGMGRVSMGRVSMGGAAQRVVQPVSPLVASDASASASASAPASSPSKRMLTPSKASLSHSNVLESSSTVVLASVRAHPRDAARLGSATFLSPVRRSTRRSVAKESAGTVPEQAIDSLDQRSLTALLEANNYAYFPNPALGRALTPIPARRATRSAAPTPAMEPIEEAEAVEASSTPVRGTPTASSHMMMRQGTPIPSSRSASVLTQGASVVVLQPVRSKSARRSQAHGSSGAVDPSSDEYLLSPVRRSSRHTAPQSLSELTHLLAHTKYAYKPNPMLAEEMQMMGQQQQQQQQQALPLTPMPNKKNASKSHALASTAAAASSSSTALSPQSQLAAIREGAREDETDEYDEEASAARAAIAFEEELQRQQEEEAEAAAAEEARLKEAYVAWQNERLASSDFSPAVPTRGEARVATPMPSKKTQRHVPHVAAASSSSSSSSASSSSTWSKSYSSTSMSDLSENDEEEDNEQENEEEEMEEVAPLPSRHRKTPSYVPSPSRVHQKDADGFLVPLPPRSTKTAQSHKRRAASLDDDVAEKMAAASGYYPSASVISAQQQQLQQQQYGSKRMATPRPQSKKQKCFPAPVADMPVQRIGTPIVARRSARVATPMH